MLNLPDFNNFVRTNRKRQGTSAIHMSHVHQNCQSANGLAWTAWMKNQNIVAMNISFLKTHRDFRILHSRTAKKPWQIMWRKRIFKWQPSKLLWILDFRCSYKSKNNGEKLLPRSLVVDWSHKLFLLNGKRSFTAASIALVNGCIACFCSWLLVIYILDVG